jgi:hypothetical protein
MKLIFINFVLFQTAWFITIYSASLGLVWFGPVFSLCWLYTHFGLHKNNWKVDLQIVVISAIIGFILDSMMVLSGIFSFSENASFGYPSSIWMVALWVNLALTLNYSLGWLKEKLILSSLFAAVGGPLAYYAGSKMGAINFENHTFSIIALSVIWAIAMPLLFYILGVLSVRTRAGIMTT